MHIKKFYLKDERFFKVLATAGNIRGTDANKIDISDTRLKNMMKGNLIKEVSYVNPKHKEEESCKFQWRLLFSGIFRIRLLASKLKCVACYAF